MNMNIFYKCSFKSSNGYKIVKYNVDTCSLTILDERKTRDIEKYPKAIMATLNYNLGRSMIMATDEKGDYFLGLYNLVDDNFEKYVNIIFTDSDYAKIVKLFQFLCNHYKEGKDLLLDTIHRIVPRKVTDELEYTVIREKIKQLINVTKNEDILITKCSKIRKLMVFVTEDNYSDYHEKLVNNCKLNIKDVIIKEQVKSNDNNLKVKLEANKKFNYLFIIIWVIILFAILLVKK